jgi:hypothetical protein
MVNKSCSWCEKTEPASVTRAASGCAEWRYAGCRMRWTAKDHYPREAFAFWPTDVQTMLVDDASAP